MLKNLKKALNGFIVKKNMNAHKGVNDIRFLSKRTHKKFDDELDIDSRRITFVFC